MLFVSQFVSLSVAMLKMMTGWQMTGLQDDQMTGSFADAWPYGIFYFLNLMENVMKLPHNLNIKNNFLGKYVRRQIDKIAKSWHTAQKWKSDTGNGKKWNEL